MFGGHDALMDEMARVELFRPSDDLLELLAVRGALLRSLDEQSRRGSTISNNDTLKNKLTTCSTDIVLDRSGVVDDQCLRMLCVVLPRLVSHLELSLLLIQSSF